jgi:hypothetical protein
MRIQDTTVANTGENFVFVIPVDQNLDLKKAAKAVSVKSIAMIKQKELRPLTGYIHGGCSPVGMKKPLRTVIDETAVLPLSQKFADPLTHRDFLGALIALGIRRSVLGDILLRQGKVYVDSRLTEDPDYKLNTDSIISVRGFGRFIYEGIVKETKKGRLFINVRVY